MIEETTPKGQGFVSTLFLVQKEDKGQGPVINLVLEQVRAHRALQDGGQPRLERPAKSRRLNGSEGCRPERRPD